MGVLRLDVRETLIFFQFFTFKTRYSVSIPSDQSIYCVIEFSKRTPKIFSQPEHNMFLLCFIHSQFF